MNRINELEERLAKLKIKYACEKILEQADHNLDGLVSLREKCKEAINNKF